MFIEQFKNQLTRIPERDAVLLLNYLVTQKSSDSFPILCKEIEGYFDSLTQPNITHSDNPSLLQMEKKTAFDHYLSVLKTYIDHQLFEESFSFAKIGENRIKKEMKRQQKAANDDHIIFRHCFSPMEYALIDTYYPSEHNDILSMDYVSLLVLQGQANFYLQRFDKAKEFFRKALELDPVSTDLAFFLADIDIQNNNWFSYEMDLDRIYLYCYKEEDLKRYYRYLAKYYKEFENDIDLYKILEHIGNPKQGNLIDIIKELKPEEKEKLEEKKIRTTISDEIKTVLITECIQSLKNDEIQIYKYYFSIFRHFNSASEINNLIHLTEQI